jgi:hypothetical protein
MGIYKMVPKAGEHQEVIDGQTVIYKAGDTVESDSDLSTRFPGKFIRLDTGQSAGKGMQPKIPIPHRFIREPVAPAPAPKIPKAGSDGVPVDRFSLPEPEDDAPEIEAPAGSAPIEVDDATD